MTEPITQEQAMEGIDKLHDIFLGRVDAIQMTYNTSIKLEYWVNKAKQDFYKDILALPEFKEYFELTENKEVLSRSVIKRIASRSSIEAFELIKLIEKLEALKAKGVNAELAIVDIDALPPAPLAAFNPDYEEAWVACGKWMKEIGWVKEVKE